MIGRLAHWQEYRPGPSTTKALHVAGFILFLISLVYVGAFAVRNWQAIVQMPALDYRRLALAAVLYALAHPFSATGWVLGVRGLRQPISFVTGIRIGLVSQIGKYLPGNVAHHFARAGLAVASGVRLANSGIATLVEVAAALLAASLVATAAMLFDPAPLHAVHMVLAGATVLPAVPFAGAVVGAATFFHFARVPVGTILAAAACLAINFAFAGLSFAAVVASLSDTALSPVAMIGIFTVAWAAGYLVPGAPAGIGVREAILVAWLGPIIGAVPAVACSLLHRLMTAFVDAAVALLAYAWLRLERRPSA